jgi:hypothetical protein
VVDAAKSTSTALVVRVLRFDVTLMTTRGTDILERVTWKLRDYLIQLMNEAANRISDDEDVGGSDRRSDGVSQAWPLPTDRFLFIAHGLGSWIVKKVLSEDSGNLAYIPMGVIFADALVPGQPTTSDAEYRNYLSQASKTFALSTSQPQFDDGLVSRFKKIDLNFEKFEKFYNSEDVGSAVNKTQQYKYKVYHGEDLTIWLGEEPGTPFKQVTSAKALLIND